jgi:hypothetical protein
MAPVNGPAQKNIAGGQPPAAKRWGFKRTNLKSEAEARGENGIVPPGPL